MPKICSVLSISPKKNIPTITAVNGSIQPSMAVVVEPISFIAYIRAELEIREGIIAKQIALNQWLPVFKGIIASDRKSTRLNSSHL